MPDFTPIPRNELKRSRLLPKGTYDFEVLKAERKTYKSGSQGIALKIGVFTENGGQQWVDDYLVFADKALFKVADFCEAVGLTAHYDAGRLEAQDCVGRAGKCRVGIDEQDGYEPRNKIAGYVASKPANAEPQRAQAQSVRVTPAPAAAGTVAANSDKDSIPF
jgi:hypothetical protein